jgi:hypothetical protein
MLNYKSPQQLIQSLMKHGMRFKNFTLVTGGDYLPDDIDWNFKDILQGHYIHTQFRMVQLKSLFRGSQAYGG